MLAQPLKHIRYHRLSFDRATPDAPFISRLKAVGFLARFL
jgi:hypothetical protein